MGDVLEVRFKRLVPALAALGPAGLLGLYVYFYASGSWPLWGLLANGIVPGVLLSLCLGVVWRRRTVLLIDSRGIEERRAGLRLAWNEIETVRIEEPYLHGLVRNQWLVVVAAGARHEWPLVGAKVQAAEIVAQLERWWGRPVESVLSGRGPTGLGVIPRRRRAGGDRERPLVVYPARGRWLRWTLFWGCFTALQLGLAVDAALSADLRALIFGGAALAMGWCTYVNAKPALQRRPHMIIDSEGIRDPAEPVPVRWEDVAEIHYLTRREPGGEHHDLLVELHDYGAFVRRWKARWRPGMAARIPAHPIKLPLGVPTSVAREEIMNRIEREWGRPFAGAA